MNRTALVFAVIVIVELCRSATAETIHEHFGLSKDPVLEVGIWHAPQGDFQALGVEGGASRDRKLIAQLVEVLEKLPASGTIHKESPKDIERWRVSLRTTFGKTRLLTFYGTRLRSPQTKDGSFYGNPEVAKQEKRLLDLMRPVWQAAVMRRCAMAGPMVGNVGDLKALLASGADANARDARGVTLLHTAAACGSKAVVEVLIAHGVDVDVKGGAGNTPLHGAILNGRKDLAELLIAHEADVNAKDREGRTPLHLAVIRGFQPIAELLLANGADVNAKTNSGTTPLHSASAVFGDLFMVPIGMAKVLLAHKADVNAKDDRGWTPLHYCGSFHESREVAELLMAHGAKPDVWVHIALNDPQKVKGLLAEGANVNGKDGEGNTLLHAAAGSGVTEVVEVLIAHGADVRAKNKLGDTPLHEVAATEYAEAAKLLIARGAAVDARNKLRHTPLHTAAITGTGKRMIPLLIDEGADVNARDGKQVTPLVASLICGTLPGGAVESLLQGGANVNARTGKGWTPLHFAAMYHNTPAVEMLTSSEAEVNAKTNKGSTPLDMAIQGPSAIADDVEPYRSKHHRAAVSLLLDTYEAEYPVDYFPASSPSIQLLLKHGARTTLPNWRPSDPNNPNPHDSLETPR
ncbi:MAG: ankyrin repeat domain-containing protein [Planctomycetes bacterium]|nr:ankyrin repeat domain-containing protein [Planctomycetota bacterium]MBL7044922.1 ankyrin repeat domain-containing protein [Pirellulaceae bacterium]